MRVKNAKKVSSELQKMQTTLSRNCCSKNAPKLIAVTKWSSYIITRANWFTRQNFLSVLRVLRAELKSTAGAYLKA